MSKCLSYSRIVKREPAGHKKRLLKTPKPAPILNCDYLDCHVNFSSQKAGSYPSHFTVKKLPHGTRHFSIIEEFFIEKKRIATIRRAPFSELLPAELVLCKFDNWTLYKYNPFDFASKFFRTCGLKFNNFARIDLSLDFQEFENGMDPSLFIKRYLTGSILKMGKAAKFKVVGTQTPKEHTYESLRFGSLLSEISYYIYNKTKEMEQVKWKPWIHSTWESNGFAIDKDVWRLEFSVKSGNKILLDADTGESKMIHSLETLQRDNMKIVYEVLRDKYWQFVWNDGQQKKNRMRKLKLFKPTEYNFQLCELEGHKEATRSTKIFIKKLEETATELRGADMEGVFAANHLKAKMISDFGLQQWAVRKGIA